VSKAKPITSATIYFCKQKGLRHFVYCFCHWDFGIRYCLGFRIWNLGFAGKSGNLFCPLDKWMQQLMISGYRN
jgi:hypothetical protein